MLTVSCLQQATRTFNPEKPAHHSENVGFRGVVYVCGQVLGEVVGIE
jgi:hypothetical protein